MYERSALPRLVLGTVQLGMPYGVANQSGKPDKVAAARIIQTAWQGGIRYFDTARAYGNSEQVLGAAFCRLGISGAAQVISKLPPNLSQIDGAHIQSMLQNSLDALAVPSLYGLMLHREEHLSLVRGLIEKVLCDMLEKRMVRFFGVSVYSPDAALEALRLPLVSLVQLPASVFDRRFEQAGVFALARELNKEIHIRSALLQGVLCLAPEELPFYLAPLKSALAAFRSTCASHGVEAAPAAIGWLLQRYPEARVLFGAERPEQVRINLDFLCQEDSIPYALYDDFDAIIPPQETALLNPAHWKNQ